LDFLSPSPIEGEAAVERRPFKSQHQVSSRRFTMRLTRAFLMLSVAVVLLEASPVTAETAGVTE
jgi:hypothetical protein